MYIFSNMIYSLRNLYSSLFNLIMAQRNAETSFTFIMCFKNLLAFNFLINSISKSLLLGLTLNVKISKAMWLGKWEKNKSNPLNLKWMRSPLRIFNMI